VLGRGGGPSPRPSPGGQGERILGTRNQIAFGWGIDNGAEI